jgi:RNAse (barnase) inhibitor barstar
MDRLRMAFEKKRISGIYMLYTDMPSDAIGHLARQLGYTFFYIDGEEVTSKEKFLRVAKVSLQFPDYFGYNWDAFFDCLKDMPGTPPSDVGYIILYDRFERFAGQDPDNFQIALHIFQATVRHFQDTPSAGPFYVLLRGDRGIIPEFPFFDK